MGCDIHSVAQVLKGLKWKTVLQDVAGDNRNYDTFAVLANVRNGYGFAGCDTGDGYEPICEPKGFPEDFLLRPDDESVHLFHSYTPTEGYDWLSKPEDAAQKKQYIDEAENKTEMWMGDHSFSWHTLAELKAYIKRMADKRTKKRGYVTEEVYKTLDGIKAPESYCGGVGGRDLVQMSAKEYEYLKKTHSLPPDKEIYIQYEWIVGYTDNTYLDEIVESLERLKEKHHVDDANVRMVFGFDN